MLLSCYISILVLVIFNFLESSVDLPMIQRRSLLTNHAKELVLLEPFQRVLSNLRLLPCAGWPSRRWCRRCRSRRSSPPCSVSSWSAWCPGTGSSPWFQVWDEICPVFPEVTLCSNLPPSLWQNRHNLANRLCSRILSWYFGHRTWWDCPTSA